MFAKRITLIYMLYKKIDYDTVSKTLKISTSTISRYSIIFDDKNSQLSSIFKKMEKEETYVRFFDDLLTNIFIQPGVKIGHWKHYWDRKKRKQTRESTGL